MFVGTQLLICIYYISCIFKVFIYIDLIQIRFSYIFPIGQSVMHRLTFRIIFATL